MVRGKKITTLIYGKFEETLQGFLGSVRQKRNVRDDSVDCIGKGGDWGTLGTFENLRGRCTERQGSRGAWAPRAPAAAQDISRNTTGGEKIERNRRSPRNKIVTCGCESSKKRARSGALRLTRKNYLRKMKGTSKEKEKESENRCTFKNGLEAPTKGPG